MIRIEKDNSFSKGFKFALGVVLFLVIFFWFFRPSVVVAPLDSEGNVIVPKDIKENVVYSSLPLKEANTETEEVHLKVIANSYELKEKIGELPDDPLYDYILSNEEYRKSIEATFIDTAKKGYIYLILDLTITNQGSNIISYYDILLKDKEGYTYEGSYFSIDKPLKQIELNQDEKVSGNVVFEVPNDIKKFDLRIDYYSGEFFDSVTYTNELNLLE